MEVVSKTLLATQYQGDATTAADVLAMCQRITPYSGNEWSIASQDSARLVMRETSPVSGLSAPWPITAGQWVVVAPDTGIVARMTAAAYADRYRAFAGIISEAVAANLNTIAASTPVQDAIKAEAVAAAARAMYGGMGAANLPTLAVGATSAAIDITILPAQPDVQYVPRAFALSAGAVLSTLEIVSVTKVNGSSARVVVKNNGVLAVGGVLLLHVTPPVGGTTGKA